MTRVPVVPYRILFVSLSTVLLSILLSGCSTLSVGPGGSSPTPPPTPGSVNSIDHVIFMMQENHSFDNYFGMLNPYRQSNGWNVGADGNTYNVDGRDDKLVDRQ